VNIDNTSSQQRDDLTPIVRGCSTWILFVLRDGVFDRARYKLLGEPGERSRRPRANGKETLTGIVGSLRWGMDCVAEPAQMRTPSSSTHETCGCSRRIAERFLVCRSSDRFYCHVSLQKEITERRIASLQELTPEWRRLFLRPDSRQRDRTAVVRHRNAEDVRLPVDGVLSNRHANCPTHRYGTNGANGNEGWESRVSRKVQQQALIPVSACSSGRERDFDGKSGPRHRIGGCW